MLSAGRWVDTQDDGSRITTRQMTLSASYSPISGGVVKTACQEQNVFLTLVSETPNYSLAVTARPVGKKHEFHRAPWENDNIKRLATLT